MLSRKSYFNATLFRKNLSRFWPLWGGVSLVGSVFPLYMLLTILGNPYIEVNAEAMARSLYGVVTMLAPGFLLVYAALCGVLVWSYLNSSRSVGLYHSLPVNRTCLYLTGLASGLAMVLIPFAVVGLLFCLVCLGCGILPLAAVGQTVLAVLGLAVFYFSTATLAAMITGNSFAMLAFYFIGHFLAVILESLVTTFASGFLFGLESSYTGALSFLSPTVYLYGHFTMPYDRPLRLEGLWVVGIYALAGLAVLALGFLLYRRRRSESAGDVVAQRWLHPVFRYGLALCSSLTAGQLLYELVYRFPFQTGRYNHMVPMALCMIVTGILGYYVASMLLKKTLRVFRGDWQGPLTAAAMVVILCGCVSFDLLGTAAYVPEADQVETVWVSAGVGYSLDDVPADSSLGRKVFDIHRAILADEDYIRAMVDQWDTSLSSPPEALDEDLDCVYVTIRYTMTNGDTVSRVDPVVLVKARWYNQPDTFDWGLRALLCSPEAAVTAVTPPAGYALQSAYCYAWSTDMEDLSLAGGEARALYDAVLEDAAALRLYCWDPFAPSQGSSLGTLEFTFQREDPASDGRTYISVELYTGMTSTFRVLQELGWTYAGAVDADLAA